MTDAYRSTLDWLYALEARRGMDFRLERLTPVLAALDGPERAFRCVHVAGTNGKGSTAAMIEAAFRAGGYRTGLYTSPHLVSFRERIRSDGQPITTEAVVGHVAAVRAAMEATAQQLTFFEIATLAAFLEFRARRVDVAVIETGLGGRLDATNVVGAAVAVLTSVDLDHTEFLGTTIEEIAAEKVGILAPSATLVTGPLPPQAEAIVAARVRAQHARWLAYGRDFFPALPRADASLRDRALPGAHQGVNAAVAAAAVAALSGAFPVAPELRDRAIAEARWPGRLEVIEGRPMVVLDAAHNPHAAAALAATLDDWDLSCPERRARPRVLVFGAMADKDWPAMLATLLPRFDAAVLTRLPMARAEEPERFLSELRSRSATTALPNIIVVAPSPEAGLETALALARGEAGAHGSVVVAGSIFLLGHLYRAAGGKSLESDLGD